MSSAYIDSPTSHIGNMREMFSITHKHSSVDYELEREITFSKMQPSLKKF